MRGLRIAARRRPALLPAMRRACGLAQPATGADAALRARTHAASRRRGREPRCARRLPATCCRDGRAFAGRRPPAPAAAHIGAARARVPRFRRAARRRRWLSGAGHARLHALPRASRAARHRGRVHGQPERHGSRRRDARQRTAGIRTGTNPNARGHHERARGDHAVEQERLLAVQNRIRRRLLGSEGAGTGQEAAADQARLPDRALRRAVRVSVRAILDRALPDGNARAQGRAARQLRRGLPRRARERDRAAERPGADSRNGRQLPQLHGDHTHRQRPRRTGARQRLRLPRLHADAPRPAHRQAPHVARVHAGDRRRRRHARRVRSPRARAARPDGRRIREQRAVRDVPQPIRVPRICGRLAAMRRRRRRTRQARGRPHQREEHAQLRLRRARPLPRRQPHAVHARRSGRRRAGRHVPRKSRPRDHRARRRTRKAVCS